MAKQTINLGAAANDGTGTNLRAAGDMINDNFDELYPQVTVGKKTSIGFMGQNGPGETLILTYQLNTIGTITIDPYVDAGLFYIRNPLFLVGKTFFNICQTSADGSIIANNISNGVIEIQTILRDGTPDDMSILNTPFLIEVYP